MKNKTLVPFSAIALTAKSGHSKLITLAGITHTPFKMLLSSKVDAHEGR